MSWLHTEKFPIKRDVLFLFQFLDQHKNSYLKTLICMLSHTQCAFLLHRSRNDLQREQIPPEPSKLSYVLSALTHQRGPKVEDRINPLPPIVVCVPRKTTC